MGQIIFVRYSSCALHKYFVTVQEIVGELRGKYDMNSLSVGDLVLGSPAPWDQVVKGYLWTPKQNLTMEDYPNLDLTKLWQLKATQSF